MAAAEAQALQTENDELRRLAAQQSDLLVRREELLAQLSGLRQQFPDGAARIVLGRIESFDSDPNRETVKISPGRLRGIEVGDWVASGIAPGTSTGGRDGRELLFRQALIGIVIDVEPYVSRVQLVSDPRFETKAVVAQSAAEGSLRVVGEEMVLRGIGKRRMRIESSIANHLESGATTVLAPASERLPTRMILGVITGAEQRSDSALHFDLRVLPAVDLDRVVGVFVIVPDRVSG